MKILWVPFTKKSRVASVRLRCLYPVEWLRGRGHRVEVNADVGCADVDVTVFSKRYDSAAQRAARRLKLAGVSVLLDICDNHFYSVSDDSGSRRRCDDLKRMIECCSGVVTASETLNAVVREAIEGERPLTVIPDPVEDLVRLKHTAPVSDRLRWLEWRRFQAEVAALRNSGAVGLVWFGNHGVDYSKAGGLQDLGKLRGLLESRARMHPIYLSVISNNAERFRQIVSGWNLPTHYLSWTARYFGEALRLHDIALIPIERNPFTLCKTANRLALALSQQLAVVADAIPSYEPFRDVVVLDDWPEGLDRYLGDAADRRRTALNGRERVLNHLSIQRIGAAWEEVLEKNASGTTARK